MAASGDAAGSSKRKRTKKDERPHKKRSSTASTIPLGHGEQDENDEQQGDPATAALRFRRSAVARLALSALRRCFQSDRCGFVDKARFELLLPSIVSQLDCGSDYSSEDASRTFQHGGVSEVASCRLHADELVGPCLAQLASACGKDALWKSLANAVLMRTRSGNVGVRVAALVCLRHCFEVVGEEFLALLPECLPFLSELLEVRKCLEVLSDCGGYTVELEGFNIGLDAHDSDIMTENITGDGSIPCLHVLDLYYLTKPGIYRLGCIFFCLVLLTSMPLDTVPHVLSMRLTQDVTLTETLLDFDALPAGWPPGSRRRMPVFDQVHRGSAWGVYRELPRVTAMIVCCTVVCSVNVV